jgi:anaphase-promoting complex subunit 4
VFGLDPSSVSACLDLAGRAVVMSSWMAAQARNERSRFTHFIAWLRYGGTRPFSFHDMGTNPGTEVARTHTGDPPPPPPPLRHDMLKVNEYLMSGLEKSNLDRFFVGPIPQFTLQDLGVPGSNLDLAATLASARVAAEAPETLLEPVRDLPATPNRPFTCVLAGENS